MENPDVKSQSIDHQPMVGDLRFVERGIETGVPEIFRTVRILQRYEWCFTYGTFEWFDVPLCKEEISKSG